MPEPLEGLEDEIADHGKDSRFNGGIALFVAVVATFMALCNVKDGNVTQAMAQSQARSVNQWAYYQAKGTKQHLAENTALTLRALLEASPALKPEARAKLEARIAEQEATAQREERDKAAVKVQAEQAARDYDALNRHDDQFDLAEACLSVAVALAGVSALTARHWLFRLAFAFGGVGFIFGLAGFLGWNLHSDLMARLLG
jgi:hypothetical protein